MQNPGGGAFDGGSDKSLRLPSVLLAYCLALDESFFQHLLVAEPQIGDIG